ncbi:MAG: hypothetical protein Q9174_002691 [Haloplaca sp. 1 TL-2023]
MEPVPPDAPVFSGKVPFEARNGELVSVSPDEGLKTGKFVSTVTRDSDRFARYILGSDERYLAGYMYIDRPVPDPDTLFDSFAQDPLLKEIPTALHSELNPASLLPEPTPGCSEDKDGEAGCLLVIPSADVFYFGPEPTNTGCMAAMPTPPPAPAPPEVSMDPSSVYVVYHSPQIFDRCRKWLGGIHGPPITMSYPSASLSTLEHRTDGPPATKTFGFADMPCPPTSVAGEYREGAPYFPVLVSPFGMRFGVSVRQEDGVLLQPQQCRVAAVRDPPVRAVWVGAISGPDDGGGWS